MSSANAVRCAQKFIAEYPDFESREYKGKIILAASEPIGDKYKGIYMILSPEDWALCVN